MRRPVSIALASCAEIPEPDVDEALLLEALRNAGAHADVLAWDDPKADFSAYDRTVLRSTWNYYEHVDAFRAWIERTDEVTRLANPAAVLRANVDKSYLRELAARGIAIVPTEFVAQGDRRALEDAMDALGTDRVVVKPTISAGSFRTRSFRRDQVAEGQRFLDELTRDRDAMIQRWMAAVDTVGERSLVWIDGTFTHAIRKSPRFAGGVESVSAAMPIADDEQAFGERVLAPLAADLLYARVDTIRDGDVLRIMELELLEPSLFFRQSPAALARFVAALTR